MFLSNVSTSNQHTHSETTQLREVTELLNSYQQKIALFNDEIILMKQELTGKDKEIDQLKIQLKNLKRSRSSEAHTEQRYSRLSNMENKNNNNSNNNDNNNKEDQQRKHRSLSADTSDTLSRQVDIAQDEIRLLKNKINRLEDDLLIVTQVWFKKISFLLLVFSLLFYSYNSSKLLK